MGGGDSDHRRPSIVVAESLRKSSSCQLLFAEDTAPPLKSEGFETTKPSAGTPGQVILIDEARDADQYPILALGHCATSH